MAVGEPDEGQQQLLLGREGLVQQLFVATVCLTDLPFNPVSIHGVLEALLRYGYQYLHLVDAEVLWDGKTNI